ncbi:zf-HC2 domain-containing protein [Candidatus Palauibacter polyketidifaciens]|uniref:zf-HC2 domain-containing protein n=1 Tax=Candidatus Palauibacter polyketidifaciens TaxID=3056740 RepID=UPI0023829957|nr:zf-HC2 domain-containing protein [Candidatus Palauibacter polyketidifaciens]MDE2719046.1 zf-HC2 domain-containing protein [Candidatus Palauibacter polyketidifaciens]
MESCKHIDEWTLNRYADGELSGPSAAAVRQHLRSCAICRREVRLIRELSAALRALPTPNPPDGLFEEIYPQEAGSAAAIPFPVAEAQSVAFSRRLVLSGGAFLIAGIAAVLALTIGPERAMAGASTLRFHREEPGALTLRYETVSPLAAEPGLRARLRYWVPDSLRFAQTEPGYRVVELSREDPGVFSGAVGLPPGAVYAVAAVEHLDGNYIDSDFGRSWEYLKTDAEGRATLDARLYQVLATADLSPARAVEVTGQALSEYPERPELWAALLLYERGAPLEDTGETPPGAHGERLERMDAAARLRAPGPGEMHALSLYARLLGREDIEAYWRSELTAEHPRHEYASQARLRTILRSSTSPAEKLDALDRSWRLAPMPSVAQVGLQLAQEVSDPALTRVWLERYASDAVFRDSRLDVEVTEGMAEVPALGAIAEEWILQQLNGQPDWLGPDRPLAGTRANFEAEAAESLARLQVLLGRLRLTRGDRAGAFDAFERAAELSWNPRVFVELARFHAEAGSSTRAAQLLALAQADPVIPLEPHVPEGEDWAIAPTEGRLAVARAAWREHLAASLLAEWVNGSARLATASGKESTLHEATGGDVTLVIHSLQPSLVPSESFDLLEANAANLGAEGAQMLLVAVEPDPPNETQTGAPDRADSIPPFLYDGRSEVWEALGAWKGVQCFVVDATGILRYRGEDLATALRLTLMLRDGSLSSLTQLKGSER